MLKPVMTIPCHRCLRPNAILLVVTEIVEDETGRTTWTPCVCINCVTSEDRPHALYRYNETVMFKREVK